MNNVEKKLIEYLESEHKFEQMVLWNDEKLGLEISIILITLITITVILMWSNYLAHQITDPIVQLSSVATRISKGDLIDTRIDIESNDEIGELVAAFNRMVNTYRILDTLAKEGTSPE